MEKNKPIEQLTKKERKKLKQQEKMEAKEAIVKSRQAKKITRWIGWSAFGLLVIVGLVWIAASQPKTLQDDILSRSGFHWHPEVTIYIKGIKQDIPENIGIGAVHKPIHTHDDSGQGIVHMEFQGLVRKQNATLGKFLKNWGKDINSFGTNVKMTVNGQDNTELENYVMNDKDKIELRFD